GFATVYFAGAVAHHNGWVWVVDDEGVGAGGARLAQQLQIGADVFAAMSYRGVVFYLAWHQHHALVVGLPSGLGVGFSVVFGGAVLIHQRAYARGPGVVLAAKGVGVEQVFRVAGLARVEVNAAAVHHKRQWRHEV